MIKIDFNNQTLSAVISASEDIPDTTWADIRRICEGSDLKFYSFNSKSILIPWVSFINLRKAIGFVLYKYKLEPEYGSMAQILLERTLSHENYFKNINDEERVGIDEIQNQLSQLGFKRILTKEQVRNVAFLISLPAAATFSVPGAGKTTEALAYFILKKQKNSKLIVVSPKNAFAVWEEQLIECLPNIDISIERLQGGTDRIKNILLKNPTIGLITYQQFSLVSELIGNYLSRYPSFMFLDESHRIKKGYTGVQGSSILNISYIPEYKLILTGTPMPNSIDDLKPQFTFLYPEIQVNNNSIAENMRKIYVRTTKNELGLKKPDRTYCVIPMGYAQKHLYDNIRSEIARELEGLSIQDIVKLRSFNKCLIRLIQVVSEPALLAESELSNHYLLKDAIDEGGPKIKKACSIARDLASKNKKCIIWSQFVQNVESIANELSDLGAEYIHGGVEIDDDDTNIESRESKIRIFHKDKNCKVLVANPAACAESISLHKVCHNAIYVDRSYNAAHYLQSEDRIHRLGLDPNIDTKIMILTCPDSIDESINKRLEWKVKQMSNFLNDKSLNIEPLQIIDEENGLVNEDIEDIKKVIFGV